MEAYLRGGGPIEENPMRPSSAIASEVRTLQGQNLYSQGNTTRTDNTRPAPRAFGNRNSRGGPPGGGPPGRAPERDPPGGSPPGGNLPWGGSPARRDPDDDDHQRDWIHTRKISSHIDIFDGDRAKAKKFQMEFGLAQMTNPNHQNMRVLMQWVALALSYIKGEDVNEWCHGYANILAEEVYTYGTDSNNERLWDDFVLAFVCHFWDTGEEKRAWAQLLIIKMKDDNLDGYIAKFEPLLQKAGRDRHEAANVDIFKQGLKTWLFQMIMRRRPLLLTLDEWQWTAWDKFSANAIMKATLGGGQAKGGFSAWQNYYATLHNTPKPSRRKPRNPDTIYIDAMHTSKLLKEEWDKLREECKCFNCKRKGHLARDCWKKDSEYSEQKDKGKKPQSRVRSAKVEEVANDRESEDEGPSTSKEESPPSYEKKDDIVAAIRRMTVEQKESALEQLAAEGFWSIQCQQPGCGLSLMKRMKCTYCTSNLCDQYEDSLSIFKWAGRRDCLNRQWSNREFPQ